jgi:phosphatidylethanolamine-binding protein (PEBP) family uncharacterized protein
MAFAGSAVADMSVSFDWGPTAKCFDKKSPPISLSGVPAGTTKLDIQMTDRNKMDFRHGGGKVAYDGKSALPYGAFRYTGPCPPPPQKHKYRFTVKALDAKGKILATAQAEKMFQQ